MPMLCAALRRENPNYSNYDIGEIVKKDCIQIWQRDTISKALPEEYKDKLRSELGKNGRRKQLEQSGGLVTEYGHAPDSNRAKDDSFGPIEDISENLDKTNRGHDVESTSEIVEILKKKLTDMTSERDYFSNMYKLIKERTLPQMFQEIQEKFYDEPGLIKGDKLRKVNMEAGKNLVFMLERCNSVLQEAVEKGQPVPIGLYIIARPNMVFVPVRFTIDFDKKKLNLSLWEKKLQGPY
jgi:polyhydroxyalkanoate synthesis regulator phasin